MCEASQVGEARQVREARDRCVRGMPTWILHGQDAGWLWWALALRQLLCDLTQLLLLAPDGVLQLF